MSTGFAGREFRPAAPGGIEIGNQEQTMRNLLTILVAMIAFGPALAALAAEPATGDDVHTTLVVQGQIGKLASPDPAARQLAMQALGALHTRAAAAVDPLIGFLGKPEQAMAGDALVEIGAPAVEPLVAKLKDANADLRLWAADLLGRLKDPRAKEGLLALLTDPDMRVRHTAAQALGQFTDKGIVEMLATMLKAPGLWERWTAMDALVQSGKKDSLETIVAAAKDESPSVRILAALTFKQASEGGTVETLIALAKDENPAVRLSAVLALGQVRDAKAVSSLIEALADKETDVSREAARSLRLLTGQTFADAAAARQWWDAQKGQLPAPAKAATPAATKTGQ
jgi:HEAT repeat protein